MSRGRRNAAAAVALSAGSVAAAFVIKRRGARNRPHVGLYFEDGSMVSLPDSSPQAVTLLEQAREALALVHG